MHASAGRTTPARRRHRTPRAQAEIAYAFEKLAAGEGVVAARHVKVALRAMGFPVKKSDVAELLAEHGHEPDAALDWPAFSELVSSKVTERTPQDEVRRAFQLFDLTGSGRISLADLSAIARQLQCGIEPAELADMIGEFDADGDGCIDEAEFRAIVMPDGEPGGGAAQAQLAAATAAAVRLQGGRA